MSSSNSPASAIALNVAPARAGITWVKQGIHIFLKQPFALMGLFFMFTAVIILLSLLPFGSMFALILLPALNAGYLKSIMQVTEGILPKPSTLFSTLSNFAQSRRPLLILGLHYFLLIFILKGIIYLFGIGDSSFAKLNSANKDIASLAAVFQSIDVQLSLLTITVMQIPLWVSFWHSPYLVFVHNIPPSKAIFFSFVAFFRNYRAMAVFFLTWLGVFFFSSLVLSVMVFITGTEAIATLLVIPLLAFLVSAFMCSTYFTICDCFLFTNTPDT